MNIADKYLQEDIRKILEEGVLDVNPRPVWEDGTPAHTKFVTHHVRTFDISKGEFPITTIKPTATGAALRELRWMFQEGSNDLDVLENKYNVKWWRPWDIGDGTIGLRYGGTIGKYDLTNKLLKGIMENPYGRRHIIDLWQENDFEETPGLNPCLMSYLFSVRGEYLDLMLIQRSSDLIAAGNIDAIQSTALLMMVAKHCGYKPGKFTWVVNNFHIYDKHEEIAKEFLERECSDKQPRLVLDTDKTNFFEITEHDFRVENYEPQPRIAIPLAV
ncbi:MAG TPA: thymidylate synthase [Lachnospiraceae bacterium]|nr:thymidylate synthase [uncultured Lachnoclostridium sp.]HAU85142.1 thymidylate synthase [Lachnospiraceae bacterium]